MLVTDGQTGVKIRTVDKLKIEIIENILMYINISF
jgi:hypothetical protein